MEYIAIVILFALGFVAVMLHISASIFWLILVGTVLAWILSLVFQGLKMYEPFRICYDVFYIGRIISFVMFVALLIIKWLIPWM